VDATSVPASCPIADALNRNRTTLSGYRSSARFAASTGCIAYLILRSRPLHTGHTYELRQLRQMRDPQSLQRMVPMYGKMEGRIDTPHFAHAYGDPIFFTLFCLVRVRLPPQESHL